MTASLKVLMPYYAISCAFYIAFRVLKLMCLLPFTESLIAFMITKIATIEMRKEDYWEDLFGWEMLKTHQDMLLLELQKEAKCGCTAPNPTLVSPDASTRFRLLEFSRGNRPMVVNFGSRTCPVFMARLCEFGEIVEEFRGIADFVTIYIKEAHPNDEWKLKNNYDIRQHQTLEERCKAAQELNNSGRLHTPLLVDTMENEANKAFGAMPIRLYIIQNGHVQYAGGIGPTFYKTADVKAWLESFDGSDPNNNNADLKAFTSDRHRA